MNQINPNSDPDLLTSNSFQKNGKVLIYRIFENLLTIFPALSNLYRKGISKEKLRNAFQRMNFDELKNPQFEIPIIASNLDPKGPKTLSIIQTRQNLKSLPVIEENPKKSMKFQINSMKMNSSIQNQKISPDAKSNLSFSKIQTKESEVASSVDLNSSFKSLPPNNLLGKGNKFLFFGVRKFNNVFFFY